jgi:hypothetical protein
VDVLTYLCQMLCTLPCLSRNSFGAEWFPDVLQRQMVSSDVQTDFQEAQVYTQTTDNQASEFLAKVVSLNLECCRVGLFSSCNLSNTSRYQRCIISAASAIYDVDDTQDNGK